ncbi:hypothetical protein AB0K02_23575 [Streptomyces sp. NPDC049597]|uniref:hypothetical protein n=1 Tax=Streptomyces sp. NPDC049597 TaxID=3155276 RepID=UPI00341DC0A7
MERGPPPTARPETARAAAQPDRLQSNAERINPMLWPYILGGCLLIDALHKPGIIT